MAPSANSADNPARPADGGPKIQETQVIKTNLWAIILASGAMAVSGSAMAGDAAAGAKKAEDCLECHEPAEDFAGQSADELIASMKSIVSGQMKHKKKVALSDADIADIAAYFATAK